MTENGKVTYNYSKWWTRQQEDSMNAGDYSEVLEQFNFEHKDFPNDYNFFDKFINFYTGNGQIGMLIDMFGAQSLPYVINDSNYVNDDAIDKHIGDGKSDEIRAENYFFNRNTHPVISSVDNWATAPACFSNTRGRGKFSMRCSVFPIIDGLFDTAKVSIYKQIIDIWNNKIITKFDYSNSVRITVTSFTSWDENRLAVFKIQIENMTSSSICVGGVAEPIVYFRDARVDFFRKEELLCLDYENEELLYGTALSMGVTCDGNRKTTSDSKIKAEYKLHANETYAFTAYFAMQNAFNDVNPLSYAMNAVNKAVESGFDGILNNHQNKVHEYWKKWWILLPWKDLCRVYYRNAIICGGNLRDGKWYPAISTLADSSYSGGGWGMDNIPVYDFMLQTGHANSCKNVLSLFAEKLPDDPENYGSQFNYSLGDNPTSMDRICNSSGNYAWLMYEYYRYTQEEEFLSDKAYKVMKSMSNFWSGYANNAGGFFGIWSKQTYNGKLWYCHSYDEAVHKISGHDYAEADNIIDVIAPAKCILKKSMEVASKLGVDVELIKKWGDVADKLVIPQNEKCYLGFIGENYSDNFPFRNIQGCAVLNTIYPTFCNDIEMGKLEMSYQALRDNIGKNGCEFMWDFNYSVQLWAAVARLRIPDELQWLVSESSYRLGNVVGFDGMTFFERNPSFGAVYFMMPYGMLNVSVNDMLLQSYDGIVRVFPCIPTDIDTDRICFMGLTAFDGFSVSAQRENRKTLDVTVQSTCGNECKIEIPVEWKHAIVQNVKTGHIVTARDSYQNIRLNKKETVVSILSFQTEKGECYCIRERVEDN